MSNVLITVDTELSPRLHARGTTLQDNISSSVFGSASGHAYGIEWQMDRMERCGITGVFFVDPMPALVYGPDCVAQIVAPIVRRGHEIQVHLHTEWLEWAANPPVDRRQSRNQGRNVGDFTLTDQTTLIGWAREALIAAGAPPPSAFRAGNFGANDDTLRALARLGLVWDTSFNPAYADIGCNICLNAKTIDPVEINGVTELPVAGIWDQPNHFRPAQVCALSRHEMRLALDHAAATDRPVFVAVTHSFEMLSRDRTRPNQTVIARFETLCEAVAARSNLEGVGFNDLDPGLAFADHPPSERLPPDRLRTLRRHIEQAYATWRFERQLLP